MSEPLSDAQVQQMLMALFRQQPERLQDQSPLDTARAANVTEWISHPWLGGKPGAQTFHVPTSPDGMGSLEELKAYHAAVTAAREEAARQAAINASMDAWLKAGNQPYGGGPPPFKK